MSATTTYSPTDGRPAESMPPIRVGVFRDGKLYHTVELFHPAVKFAKAWKALSMPSCKNNDELRVLPDDPQD